MKNRLFKTCVTGLLLSLAGLANADHIVPSTNGDELNPVSVGMHAEHAAIPVVELITIGSLAAFSRVNDADVD
jgi:Trk K+ transport system NAD-binding subunit